MAIGVILCAPFMFGNGGAGMQGQQWILAQGEQLNTGIIVIDGSSMVGIPPLNAYIITPQNTKIFVIIASIFLAKKIDNWIITWIPAQIELTFRWFLVIGLTTLPAFFVFGPIWFYLEKIIGIGVHFLTKIPGGIGVGISGAIIQIAVLFGAHVPLGFIFGIDAMVHQGFGSFTFVTDVGAWGQFGALIGVWLITKNATTKRDAANYSIAAIFGISEPMLFGVNLPKRWPLLAGATAAFFAGVLAGLLGVTGRINSGVGIFLLIGFFSNSSGNGFDAVTLGYLPGWQNGLYMLLCVGVSIGLGILFTMFLYKERVSEKRQLIKNDKLFVKYLLTKKYINEQQAQDLLNNLISISTLISKEDGKKIKDIEKQYQRIAKVQDKISHTETQLILYKDKFILKGKKLLKRGKKPQAELLYEKYDTKAFEDKIAKFKIELEKLKGEIDDQFIYDFQNHLKDKYLKIVNEMPELNEVEKDKITRRYQSILNSLRITYRLDEFDDAEINFAKEIGKMKKANKLELKTKKVQVHT
ncbi:PTS transporter subunit EIIC [Williamsoniiplasma luminosum]|uniref:PTS transporter subunit EIIC n=1 Tax=Williamsoniiplasma luminosum TaxID=214888 RepID=UPI0012EB6EB9|nr:PTS transporter subunit EIIC [Williamsoniiplasma luminosum]